MKKGNTPFLLNRGPTQYTQPYGEMMDFDIHSVIYQKVMHLAKI